MDNKTSLRETLGRGFESMCYGMGVARAANSERSMPHRLDYVLPPDARRKVGTAILAIAVAGVAAADVAIEARIGMGPITLAHQMFSPDQI